MEGTRSPSPGNELELSELERQPDEQTPLNGAAQVISFSAEPGPAQANPNSPQSSCNRKLIRKCRRWWLVIIFLGLIGIGISLFLIRVSLVTYVDEDENEIPELSSNKTFLVILKIPEECVAEEELPHLLTKKLTDVYNSSSSLSRYFTSVEVVDFRAVAAHEQEATTCLADISVYRGILTSDLDQPNRNLGKCPLVHQLLNPF
ncbi:TPA-induced transmembrane protein isoform X2 [Rousettus aegyptiacus]|uniref:TPA-induced transmembrane protein isoform X2 n=1 Tax=Rousettus aegyptiacus TaxID=9407 RepID=UPI00168CE3E2|nr:TPA-induced transmembrane protein isoform X2 [Rousettus aegyptiacus]